MLHMLAVRATTIRAYLGELRRFGLPEVTGGGRRDVVVLLDGVGGTQFAPVILRKVIREADLPMDTVLYHWHRGTWGNSLTDLVCLRRNRVMAAGLARLLLRLRRERPQDRIHVWGYSGGTALAVFALEALSPRMVVDTLVLAAPALSPGYDLSTALRGVRRCHALISERDSVVLGLGTRLLGTMDRQRTASAGRLGFLTAGRDPETYGRLTQFAWQPELASLGHYGGHTGWLARGFLDAHLRSLVLGEPSLPRLPTG